MKFFDRENVTLLMFSPNDVPEHVMRALTARYVNAQPRLWLAATIIAATSTIAITLLMLARKGFDPMLPYTVLLGGLVFSVILACITNVAFRRRERTFTDRDDAFKGKYRNNGLVRSVDPSYQYVISSSMMRTLFEGMRPEGFGPTIRYFSAPGVIRADESIKLGPYAHRRGLPKAWSYEGIEDYFSAHIYLEAHAKELIEQLVVRGSNLRIDRIFDAHFDQLHLKVVQEANDLRHITAYKLGVIDQQLHRLGVR